MAPMQRVSVTDAASSKGVQTKLNLRRLRSSLPNCLGLVSACASNRFPKGQYHQLPTGHIVTSA